MSIKVCRALRSPNSSLPFSSSNQSYISEAEWITTSVSLIIFVLAFIGNTAALIVMFGSRGPVRLTSNKYLANLACADLLRACFMPFTIIARMKRNFMFGKLICKILPIVQGLSVAVDIFTLVCISIERYFAICRPLLILKLQSLPFANLLNVCILLFIWFSALLIALPNFYVYNLCSLPNVGRFKCINSPPKQFHTLIYMIALDVFYFVIPMIVMIQLYTLIIWKMYRNSTAMKMRSFQNSNSVKIRSFSSSSPLNHSNKISRSKHSDSIDPNSTKSLSFDKFLRHSSNHSSNHSPSLFDEEDHQGQNLSFNTNRTRAISHPNSPAKTFFQRFSIRQISSDKRDSSGQGISRIDRHRRKALKLLITLIVEFFLCWTPLFIYHTIGTFDRNFYRSIPNIYVDLILLFSFASASCNPLTYYFMSKRYRTVLYAYLPCCCCCKKNQGKLINQKNERIQDLIKALHSHQQQNFKRNKSREINEHD